MGFHEADRFYPVRVNGAVMELPSCSTIAKVPQSQGLLWWAAGGAADAALDLHASAIADWWEAEGDHTVEKHRAERQALWKAIRGAPFAYRQQRADEGTEVHAVVEAYTRGRAVDLKTVSETARPYAERALTWLDKFKPEVVESEQAVASLDPGEEWAGRRDALWKIGTSPRLTLIDVKTRKPGGEPGPWPSEWLQLAGYAEARTKLRREGDHYVPDGEAPMPEARAILAVWPDRPARLVPVEIGANARAAFLHARALYLLLKEFETWKEAR